MAFCFMLVLCFIDMLCPGLCGTIKAAKQLGTKPNRALDLLFSFLLICHPTNNKRSATRIEPEIPYKAVYLVGR